MSNSKRLQSYIYGDAGSYFISTCNRESSAAACPGPYMETLVWEWDEEARVRGRLVDQGEGPRDSVRAHFDMCEKYLTKKGQRLR